MSAARPGPIPAPEADEYAPYYAGYVALVRGRDPLVVLKRQVPALRSAVAGMRDAEALRRYAPGKWSIKEVVGHLADAERIFAYRLLRIARGDGTPLAGFEEDAYVAAGDFDRRPARALVAELGAARASTLRLAESVAPERWALAGAAAGGRVTARAVACILAGHTEHHFGVLRERYGLAVPYVEAPPAA